MNVSSIWSNWLGLSGRMAMMGVLAMTLGLALWAQHDTANAATTIVLVDSDFFNPDTNAITEGDTVQWDWADGTHNVTPFDPADFTATGIVHFTGGGDTYSATFASAGTVWYYCTLHAGLDDMDTNGDTVVDGSDNPDFGKMIGRIDVAAASTPSPTPPPTATPTDAPTAAPTDAPTAAPTDAPTAAPTDAPTAAPTDAPTAAPTDAPTAAPTDAPTATATPAVLPPTGDATGGSSIGTMLLLAAAAAALAGLGAGVFAVSAARRND